MKALERNKREFQYQVPTGERRPILDKAGHMTGETETVYSDPVTWRGNISAGTGEAEASPFGAELSYDRVIVLAGEVPPIEENCLVRFDGQRYIVKAVAASLNSVSIAIRKVEDNG